MHTLGGLDESVIAVMVAGAFFALWVVVGSVHSLMKRSMYERSRREIAAYVAEGSMTPEDGERLLKTESAGMKDA
jgi:hypothetical protein